MSGPGSPAHRRTVSILYFEGCPNHRPTADRVRTVVADLSLDADVEELDVRTPDDVERLRFFGSPTVQVDGADIEPAARARTDYTMACRLYTTSDGLPTREMLAAALDAPHDAGPTGEQPVRSEAGGGARCCEPGGVSGVPAASPRSSGVSSGLVATGGSLVAAMLSSACCWVPMLLVAFGASAAGVSGIFGPWRPLFIVFAVAMLSLSFYLTFVRKPWTDGAKDGSAAPCCSSARSSRRRLGRATWWVSAAVVAAFVFFPQYVSLALVGSSTQIAAGASELQGQSREFTFRVEGMTCAACATTLTATLSKIDGVGRANVDYASETARVWLTDERVIGRVLDATRKTGFSVSSNTGGNVP